MVAKSTVRQKRPEAENRNTETGLFARRPALTVFAFYAIGIYLGTVLPERPYHFFALAIAAAIAALAAHLKNHRETASRLLYLTISVIGICQYQIAVTGFPPTHISRIAGYGGMVEVIGSIAEEPDLRLEKTYLTVKVDSVTWRRRTIASSGKMIVKINEPTTRFAYGDRLQFSGPLFAPGESRIPGGFDYAGYLNNRGIFAMMTAADPSLITIRQDHEGAERRLDMLFHNRVIAPIREYLLDGYARYFGPVKSALLGGFVLGERRGIPDEIARLFSDTGTLHLMAVSGSNVAIVAGFCLWILKGVGRRLRIFICLLVLVMFSFLTRNEPSVTRATAMAVIGLIGFSREKNPDYLGLLGFAGLVLLIIKPLWLFNIGFQLSMLAAGGIIYGVPLFGRLFGRPTGAPARLLYAMGSVFALTLAAQLSVLPLTGYYFDRLPLMGLLANFPMAFLASVLTVGGLLFLPFLWLGDIAARIYSIPLDVCLSSVVPLLSFFKGLPGAIMTISTPPRGGIVLYFAALYFFSQLVFFRRFSFKSAIIGLGAAGILVWTSYLYGSRSASLTFIDCGPDRAILLSSAEGRNYLWFDCHEPERCRQLELSLFPYLRHVGITKIDTLFNDQQEIITNIADGVNIGGVIHRETAIAGSVGIEDGRITEVKMNDLINIGLFYSDNNNELWKSVSYYKVKMEPTGSVSILAGDIKPEYADKVISEALVLELPWSVQPYGGVLEKLEQVKPDLLVFSPDRFGARPIRNREHLTYMEDITWSTGMVGSFRLRFEGDRRYIDHMLEE